MSKTILPGTLKGGGQGGGERKNLLKKVKKWTCSLSSFRREWYSLSGAASTHVPHTTPMSGTSQETNDLTFYNSLGTQEVWGAVSKLSLLYPTLNCRLMEKWLEIQPCVMQEALGSQRIREVPNRLCYFNHLAAVNSGLDIIEPSACFIFISLFLCKLLWSLSLSVRLSVLFKIKKMK